MSEPTTIKVTKYRHNGQMLFRIDREAADQRRSIEMTTPANPTPEPTRWLPILICDRGVGVIPFPMTEEDFGLMIATLSLWRRRIVTQTKINGPFVPMLPLL